MKTDTISLDSNSELSFFSFSLEVLFSLVPIFSALGKFVFYKIEVEKHKRF